MLFNKKLLAKLQKNFEKQLNDEYERVHLELWDKQYDLKTKSSDKENIGVELYNLQQKLADLQINFEKSHEKYNRYLLDREESQKKLIEISNQLKLKQNDLEENKTKIMKSSDELSKLNISIKEMELFYQNIVSNIKITKNITYKAEENIVKNEATKINQDLQIDKLYEEIKKLKEQKKILDAQLESQKSQTEEAKNILKLAEIEMDKIKASKKNLLEQLRESINEIEKKNKTLILIKETLKNQEEMNIKTSSEILGIKNELKKINKDSALLSEFHNSMLKEEKILDNQGLIYDEKRDKIEAKLNILKNALGNTEEEIKKTDIKDKQLEKQMNQIEINIMKLHSETRKKEGEIMDKVSEHKTIEKTSANQMKIAKQLENEIQDKQIELENIENELARVKLDILFTEYNMNNVEGQKKKLDKERLDKENIVKSYESKIKENHDLHEKKMHEVAKYNKEHAKASQKQNLFSKAPTEASLIHLNKEINEFDDKIKLLQGDFIKAQKKFVNDEIKCYEVSEKITKFKRDEVILEKKKLRWENRYNNEVKEIKNIEIELKNLENDMNKLNQFLAKNFEKNKSLKNENLNMNSEYMEKFRELENESVKLEIEIERIKEKKAETLNQITESERQILLWERKIKLEKEVQEQLDPNVGQQEILSLKKDIHIKELQLDDIKKKQDQLIVEMERAVYKRESIQYKYKNKGRNNKKETTNINQNIQILKNILSEGAKHLKDVMNKIKVKENEKNSINKQIDVSSEKLSKLEYEISNVNEEIIVNKIKSRLWFLQSYTSQKTYKTYQDILNKKKVGENGIENLSNQHNSLIEENENLIECIKNFVDENPNLKDIFNQLTSINIKDYGSN